jgi:ATP-dependent DNA ligase
MVLSKRPAYRRPGGFSLLHHARLRSERRLCARWDGQRVRCFAKNGHDWADCFPSIVEAALSMTNTTCLIDGEAGILNEDGTSNFPARRGRGRASEVVLVAFDLLEQYGRNLREQPLIERKRRLKALLGPGEASGRAIQYIDYLTGDGAAISGTSASWGWRASSRNGLIVLIAPGPRGRG